MMAQEFRIPLERERVASRKERFFALNQFVTKRHGWLTSVPGAIDVSMECLPDSSLPDELKALGYRLEPTGETQRILPHALTEKFTRGADGTFAPLVAGSTLPVAHTVTHAGIVRVLRFAFVCSRCSRETMSFTHSIG